MRWSKDELKCSWCGTLLRGRSLCPRGPFCAIEEANHDALLSRFEGQRARGTR